MNATGRSVTVMLTVEGMTCRSCVAHVKAALLKNRGVTGAEVDLVRKEARVNYDKTVIDEDALKKSIVDAGYSIPDYEAEERNEKETRPEYVQPLHSKVTPYLIGLAAALSVIGFYLGLLTLTSNWYFAKVQFIDYRWWIIALALGIGIQVALYSNIRIRFRAEAIRGAKSSIAASGGMSVFSMAVCCSHFLPTLGLPFLSAAAAGLERYQSVFFIIGVLSNAFGIGFMIRMMVKNGMIAPGIFPVRLNSDFRRRQVERRCIK